MNVIVEQPVDAVIAAGGQGARLGCAMPKSLLLVGGYPLIIYTVNSLLQAGVKRVFVCIDNERWQPVFTKLFRHCKDVFIIMDHTYSTTFIMTKSVVSVLSSNFIFTYGHAPRPFSCYNSLLRSGCLLGGTVLSTSSMRNPIQLASGLFLEQPFLINRELIKRTSARSWNEFVRMSPTRLHRLQIAAPSEFNYPQEFSVYRNYVMDVFEKPLTLMGSKVIQPQANPNHISGDMIS